MSTENDLLAAPPVRTAAPPMQRLRSGLSTSFRLPTEDDTPPRSARLLGMAIWAAACVFAGLLPAGRLIIALLFGAPAWYPPAALTLGLAGTAALAAAFGAIHRPRIPWILLAAATVLLITNVTLIYTLL